MAFSFGAGSAPAFGSTPAPAFGATSTPTFSFGGTSSPAPAFGAASTPAFKFAGAGTPAFGAASGAAPSLFGATSAAAPSPFGAVSTPAFNFGQTAPSLFGATPPSAFGTPGSAPSPFGTPAASSPSLFGGTSLFGAAQPQQQQQVVSAVQPGLQLATKDNRPVTHSTKWDDLSPHAQQYLLELEKVVSRCREQSRQLDGEDRLQSAAGARSELEDSARGLSRSMAALAAHVRTDSEETAAVRGTVMQLLRHTEAALYTFQRTHAWREAARAVPGQPLPTHVLERLGGPVALPSPFLVDTVEALRERLKAHATAAADLEALLQQRRKNGHGGGTAGDPAGALHALKSALENLHDCVMRSAAHLQALDDRVAATTGAELARRRQAGDYSNPFEEAARMEASMAQSAAKKSAAQAAQPSAAQPPQQQQMQLLGLPAPGSLSPGGAFTPAPTGLFGTAAATPATGLFGGQAGAATGATNRRRGSRR